MTDQINTIGIIGAGQMGRGIAHVFALAGFDVIVYEISEGVASSASSVLNGLLQKMVVSGKIDEAIKNDVMRRIKFTTIFNDISNSDFVIEAIPENMALKQLIFSDLHKILRPEVVIASNTSSLSVAVLGDHTGRPDKVIGMHFMNPAPVMKCVEVVRSPATSEKTFQTVSDILTKINKEKIVVKDSPGFIVNRILMPMINESVHVCHSGIASVGDIDLGMKLSCNLPMGPLALADFIGLDTVKSILDTLYVNFGEVKYKPSELLTQMLDSGKLGRKNGVGFYQY